MNAKKPSDDLSSWLLPTDYDSPDIYAIGFQEIVDLNAGNLLVDHNANKLWEDKIERTLKQQYTLLCSRHLVGLSLCIYVKRELYKDQHINDVQAETVGVGIMGVGGNKGAVGIRFKLYDSSICFINSHLAAHQNNVAGRNADFHNICARLKFTDRSKQPYDMFAHDHLFWLGDLNYRINMNDYALVYQRIDVEDWDGLLAADQLIIEKAAGRAFKQFEEGRIDFAPTYKYQPGTNKYERREDKKKRLPAWCDRIQWVGEDIKQLYYRRAELVVSDHKPVAALFEVRVKEVVEEKKREVKASIGRQLDAWENQAIPKVSFSPSTVRFDSVYYDEPVTQSLMIENTGQVVVQFHFVPKLQDATFCKSWCKVVPEFGIIPPKQAIGMSCMALLYSPCYCHTTRIRMLIIVYFTCFVTVALRLGVLPVQKSV